MLISQDISLPVGGEICLDNNGHKVSPGSLDCKLNLFLKEINIGTDPFEVKIIKGCY